MIHTGDCLDVMATMDAESIDAIVTDPPYGLEFMGKAWDHGVIGRPFAEAMLRVAKPSAYLLAFGGTRTVHRLTVALEDAGWIIRDMLVWGYASGFPKSKASLKPAWEPIVMARKPGPLRMLAIDECRIPMSEQDAETIATAGGFMQAGWQGPDTGIYNKSGDITVGATPSSGRWPANVILTDELFESGVEGVVIARSLTDTMTAWEPWSSEDSGESPIASPASNVDRLSSPTGRVSDSRASVVGPAGTQLDVWGTSTDTPKPDTGCSDGMTAGDESTSGSIGTSGNRHTGRSRTATSSTIATGTASTTDSRTSSSSPEPSTTASTSPLHTRTSTNDLSDDSANWRRNSPPVPADNLGYSRYFLIPKADRSDREPVLGGLALRSEADGSPVRNARCATCRKVKFAADDDRCHCDAPVWEASSLRANVHPTVKPVDLMRHLVRLVTPAGGTVLDPFLGSGTTGLAAEMEGFPWIGIEKEPEYVAIAEARLNGTQRGLGLVG